MFATSATRSRSSRTPPDAGGNLPQRSVIVEVGPPLPSAYFRGGLCYLDTVEPEPRGPALNWCPFACIAEPNNRHAVAVSPYGRRSPAAYRVGRAPHFPLGHVPTTSPASPQAAGFPFLRGVGCPRCRAKAYQTRPFSPLGGMVGWWGAPVEPNFNRSVPCQSRVALVQRHTTPFGRQPCVGRARRSAGSRSR